MGFLTKGVRSLICGISLCANLAAYAQVDQLAETVSFEIPAQSLEGALLELSKQSSFQIVFSSGALPDRKAPPVLGRMAIRRALDLLLQGTELGYKLVGERTLTVIVNGAATPVGAPDATGSGTYRPDANGGPGIRVAQTGRAEQNPANSAALERRSRSSVRADRDAVPTAEGIPEILVEGARVLNMDIRRTRDDAQPYVIFERDALEKSGADNIGDFLKQRLPMNTRGPTNNQTRNVGGGTSVINLRGLGVANTLILIDGRRVTGGTASTNIFQANLNGIPLAAVERIEVLPTTASGIYGGSATGGVINVVLRRDYSGVEVGVAYKNSFDSDAAVRRVDLSSGFTFEGGKTNALVAGSYSDHNLVTVQERELFQRGRSMILANNPSFFLNATMPPPGATTNVRSTNGSNLVLDNGTPLNSPITHVPAGYAGSGSDGGGALVANAGRYNFDLGNNVSTDGGGRAALLVYPVVKSATAMIRRRFTSSFQGFLEAAASNSESSIPNVFIPSYSLPATAPNNPFQQGITVRVPTDSVDHSSTDVSIDDHRLVGGMILKLPREWHAEADFTWSRVRFSRQEQLTSSGTETPLIASGAIDVLRDTSMYPIDLAPYYNPGLFTSPLRTTQRDTVLRIAGSVGALPAGKIVVSSLLEYLDEEFGGGFQYNPTSITQYPDRSQAVRSAYLEARLPIVSPQNGLPGVRELELQLAGRWDQYRVKGVTPNITVGSTAPILRVQSDHDSTNPTFGLRYRPIPDLMLRASYGTGFLPPTATQLVPNPPRILIFPGLVDPKRGNSPIGPLQQITGGNPDLVPEESESWSAGAVFTPAFVPELRVSVDYTRISKINNIAFLPSVQAYFDNEDFLPGRVTRGPVPPGDPFGVGPIIGMDVTPANLSEAEVEAYDVQLDYDQATAAAGKFSFFAVATWQTHHKTRLIVTAPEVENVGVGSGSPLKFKGNAGIRWDYGRWELEWAARHFHSYIVSTNTAILMNQGAQKVPSQTYHDFVVSYRFPDGNSRASKLVEGTEIQLGIENVFDSTPPFDAGSETHFYSSFGDPRLRSYSIGLKRAF